MSTLIKLPTIPVNTIDFESLLLAVSIPTPAPVSAPAPAPSPSPPVSQTGRDTRLFSLKIATSEALLLRRALRTSTSEPYYVKAPEPVVVDDTFTDFKKLLSKIGPERQWWPASPHDSYRFNHAKASSTGERSFEVVKCDSLNWMQLIALANARMLELRGSKVNFDDLYDVVLSFVYLEADQCNPDPQFTVVLQLVMDSIIVNMDEPVHGLVHKSADYKIDINIDPESVDNIVNFVSTFITKRDRPLLLSRDAGRVKLRLLSVYNGLYNVG